MKFTLRPFENGFLFPVHVWASQNWRKKNSGIQKNMKYYKAIK